MIDKFFPETEGYIYTVYGNESYLKQAVASATTLKRYDKERPVALICDSDTQQRLKKHPSRALFDIVRPLNGGHNSIVGFKHNVHKYMIFDRNLFLDSDMVWCKNPASLWRAFSAFNFTITGNFVADNFFGARKDFGILADIFLNRRSKTLKHFGLTHFSRVQSGMIYAQDPILTKQVCKLAQETLSRSNETHFVSRTLENGRSLESCEWSLAMAMCKLEVPVFTWMQGQMSPQIDYTADLTSHDQNFEEVSYRYYCDSFVNSLRGLKPGWLRLALRKLVTQMPGKGDFIDMTPFCLHFGWLHEKQPFLDFSEQLWVQLKTEEIESVPNGKLAEMEIS